MSEQFPEPADHQESMADTPDIQSEQPADIPSYPWDAERPLYGGADADLMRELEEDAAYGPFIGTLSDRRNHLYRERHPIRSRLEDASGFLRRLIRRAIGDEL